MLYILATQRVGSEHEALGQLVKNFRIQDPAPNPWNQNLYFTKSLDDMHAH